jgi:predicted amidohydrolase
MRAKDLPDELHPLPHINRDRQAFVLRGGSAIIGPDGRYVVEPVFDRETTVSAELDLAAIDREKMTLDVSGHYNRPDVFDFTLRKETRRPGRLTTSRAKKR